MRFLSEIESPADLRQLKIEDLQEVADEVRQFILETSSRIGGHTGASLGAVEFAVAMHYAFDTPKDRLGLGCRTSGLCTQNFNRQTRSNEYDQTI